MISKRIERAWDKDSGWRAWLAEPPRQVDPRWLQQSHSVVSVPESRSNSVYRLGHGTRPTLALCISSILPLSDNPLNQERCWKTAQRHGESKLYELSRSARQTLPPLQGSRARLGLAPCRAICLTLHGTGRPSGISLASAKCLNCFWANLTLETIESPSHSTVY